MDMQDLEEQLKDSMDKRIRLIVTDGVFSMDGDISPLKEIVALAKKYNAFTYLDDAHGTGVFGDTGRGTPEHFGVEAEIDILSSTLGKAMGGGTGGYIAASQPVISALKQKARTYCFTNSVAPCIVGASLEVFKILEESPDLVQTLRKNTQMFRKGMKDAGFEILGNDLCAIAPVYLKDAHVAQEMAKQLYEKHSIYVVAFAFPVVPRGEARIRCSVSAAHTPEQIQKTIEAFVAVGKELKIIS